MTRKSSLKKKMLGIFITVFAVVFAVIILLFWKTTDTLRQKATDSFALYAEEINDSIYDIAADIYNVSDAFANEPTLEEYLNRVYAEDDIKGRFATVQAIRNQVFSRYNILRNVNQISAIYNVNNQQLFNFVDPNLLPSSAVQKLEVLQMASPDKLSQYFWYPLQENFFRGNLQNDVRLDQVVLVSRRIYSRESMSYPYVHIFVLPENIIYQCYEQIAKQTGGEVYILDPNGNLISSSNLEAVRKRTAPADLTNAVLTRSENNFTWQKDNKNVLVSISQSKIRAGWLAVLAVPEENATREVTKIYSGITVVLMLCIILCGIMVFYIYNQFMAPISRLGEAMQKVESGDLKAFIEQQRGSKEAVSMIKRYNHMLRRINVILEEKLVLEKNTKELDMQVLTTQIHPHFLYNTLETIVWKANEAGRPDIGKIAASLGKMYRFSVNNGEVWTTVQRELEHVKSYAEIQKSRYEDLFEFEVKAEEETLPYQIPNLVIQPVVENIFAHVLPEAEKKIAIRITVQKKGKRIQIKILDNGFGMSGERLQLIRSYLSQGVTVKEKREIISRKSSGIGLRNVHGRLRMYMGSSAGLAIYSRKNAGTKVVISIPCQK